MTTDIDSDEVIRQVTDSIAAKYPAMNRSQIEPVVRQKVNALSDQPVTDYVGVLAEREALTELSKR